MYNIIIKLYIFDNFLSSKIKISETVLHMTLCIRYEYIKINYYYYYYSFANML